MLYFLRLSDTHVLLSKPVNSGGHMALSSASLLENASELSYLWPIVLIYLSFPNDIDVVLQLLGLVSMLR